MKGSLNGLFGDVVMEGACTIADESYKKIQKLATTDSLAEIQSVKQ
jgi:hypothetical protein